MTQEEIKIAEKILDGLESLLVSTLVEFLEGKVDEQQAKTILAKIGARILFGGDSVSKLLFNSGENNK